MGVSTSADQLARKLARLSHDFADLDGTVVREAANLTKTTEKAGAPSRLRGVGKKGAALNVRDTLSLGGSSPSALVFAVGPWQLIERDTKPHQIPRQRRSASFEGVFGHAVIPGGSEDPPHGKRGVRTRVHHPGTKGKHPWAKGIARVTPIIQRMFQARGVTAIGRIF